MTVAVLDIVVPVLLFGLALNLALTLRVLDVARNLLQERPQTPPLGELLPPIRGRRLGSRAWLTIPARTRPGVLLCLASACPKCAEKLAEIESMLPSLGPAGLALSLVSAEPAWRLARFLRRTALAPFALRVRRQDLKTLNPAAIYPYYLFVDAQGRVEAGGVVGDENWCAFRTQLQDHVAARREVA